MALSDGLMVIRHLFGSAFFGEALINKAISPDSVLLGEISYNQMTAEARQEVAGLVAANIDTLLGAPVGLG